MTSEFFTRWLIELEKQSNQSFRQCAPPSGYLCIKKTFYSPYRFQTTHKLCQDILNGCVEGSVDLKAPNAHELLQDTLACLASEEIKLASLKSKAEGMEEVDPNAEATAGDVAGAVLAAAKKTIISQVVKKNVIENIIPIVIALKVCIF